MAISKVSQGVYVVSPSKVDTFGGKYTELFTKEREKQWQMGQKQALMEAEQNVTAYREQMRLYANRTDAITEQKRDLEKMRDRAQLGNLTAADRAALEAFKAQQRRDEKVAERQTATSGSSSSVSVGATPAAGGGGGGGTKGKGPVLGDVTEQEKLDISDALAQGANDPAATAAQLRAKRSAGALIGETEEDSDAQNVTAINGLTDIRASKKGISRDAALNEVMTELNNSGNSDIVASYIRQDDKLTKIEEGTPAAGPPRDPSRSSSRSTRTFTRVPKYEDLETTVVGPTLATTPEDIDALFSSRAAALDVEAAKLKQPTLSNFDYITRAREITAGRFGPTAASPAYGQRNALQTLLRADEGMRSAILDQYRKTLPTVATVTPGAVAPSGTETTPGGAVATPAAPAEELLRGTLSEADRADARRLGYATAPTTTSTFAPTAMAEPAVAPPPTPPLRFTGAFADPVAEAYLEEVGLPVSARTAVLRAPSISPRLGFDNILSQRSVAGGGAAQVAPISDRMRLSGMTMQPAGYAVPVAEVRPQYVPPLELDSRGNFAAPAGMTAGEMRPMAMDTRRGPIAPKSPEEFITSMKEGTTPATQRAQSAAAAGKFVSDVKTAGAEESFGGGKKSIDPKLDYLFKRVEAASTLAKRPDKLDRLAASGVGKTARALYDANKKKNIPFSVTYEKMTQLYKGDPEEMMRAHEIVLALDMMSRDKEPK